MDRPDFEGTDFSWPSEKDLKKINEGKIDKLHNLPQMIE